MLIFQHSEGALSPANGPEREDRGIPGAIDRRTEIVIPPGTAVPQGAAGKIVLHNDPVIDPRKAWPWEHVRAVAAAVGAGELVLLGSPGRPVSGAVDLRGRTTLPEATAVIQACRCFVGIDSGLRWIAGSLRVPTVGLYGTEYIPRPEHLQPVNPNAVYLAADGPVGGIPAERVLSAVERSR